MKIVILDGGTVVCDDLSWDGLKEFGELTIYERTPNDVKTILERVGDAEMVLENKMNMSREVIEACPQLKYIGELATGYNNVISPPRRNTASSSATSPPTARIPWRS